MTTLAEFLTARLDAEEAMAREATADPGMAAQWTETTSGCLDVGKPDHGGQDWQDYVWPQGDSRVTRFIEAHDPARVLREVEAMRKIVADHVACEDWNSEIAQWNEQQRQRCATLRALAAVYSDHADYRQDWA